MDAKGIRDHRAGRIRAFRLEDIGDIADNRVVAYERFAATGAATRALRAERRCRGGTGYDLVRHIGLMRRQKRQLPPDCKGGRLNAE
ncbi:hypothetical protein [Blastochloris viridis]|uniref:Uncharacterized protein n=1 Tax=Blastochloris viridis TaxID=1079 RepID=A0A0H5BPV2_BLAVI|nr:hypothetical protein [Blastochloris viridis]ALK10161.1 hypothetical protein BVIR_2394 [Blastochloris viridis]BAR99908.1 hypothetical protein BV133_2315 [Blastochloris viridis]CUU42825.1 hypothetical protein BVIRIDIS_18400 [Blastochloris viridis]